MESKSEQNKTYDQLWMPDSWFLVTRMNTTSLHFGNVKEKNMENPDNFGSIRAGILGTSMEIHSGEDFEAHLKENAFKCSRCEFAAVQAGDLRRHLKIHNS